jgi:hypothetical protein
MPLRKRIKQSLSEGATKAEGKKGKRQRLAALFTLRKSKREKVEERNSGVEAEAEAEAEAISVRIHSYIFSYKSNIC